jgi:hypothetical protein
MLLKIQSLPFLWQPKQGIQRGAKSCHGVARSTVGILLGFFSKISIMFILVAILASSMRQGIRKILLVTSAAVNGLVFSLQGIIGLVMVKFAHLLFVFKQERGLIMAGFTIFP